jgi:hypothetical protein
MNKKSNNVMNWRNRAKLKLIEYKGGKCSICGFNKPVPGAYDFHHLDRNEKEFSIGGTSWSFERIKSEVDKCILVCRNCHAEIHHNETQERRLERLKIKQNRVCSIKCFYCKINFTPKRPEGKYCSVECCKLAKRKVSRPMKEELNRLLWEMPTMKIAKQYGVSSNAIAKWAKSYGLKKPPRGYWAKKRF